MVTNHIFKVSCRQCDLRIDDLDFAEDAAAVAAVHKKMSGHECLLELAF